MTKYVINPAYILKNDKKRVILCNKEQVDENIRYQSCFSFIHPTNAQFLSFFNGKDSLEQIKRKIANFFGLSLESTENITKKYIENPQSFSIKHQDQWMFFPENMIVNKELVHQYDVYSVEDFKSITEIDLKTDRLSAPLYINYNMIFTCFTNCIYCYANRKMKIDQYLSLERILSIVKEAKSIGVLDFSINGGEVLLHPHIYEVVKALLKNNYQPGISTKIPLSYDQIVSLKEIGIKSIQISLDSVRISTLKQSIGVEDDYMEKMKRTIEYLNKEKIEITIHNIVTSYNSNMEEFKEFVSFLSAYECVKKIRVSAAGYTLYEQTNYANIRTSEKYMEILRDFINTFKYDYPNISFTMSSGAEKKEFNGESKKDFFDRRGLCSGNVRSIIILPDGKVTICEELYDHPKFVIGDLKKHSIEEVWNSDVAKKLYYLDQNALPHITACKDCAEFHYCRQGKGVCWKVILMAYGKDNWDYPDPRCPKAPVCQNEIWLSSIN